MIEFLLFLFTFIAVCQTFELNFITFIHKIAEELQHTHALMYDDHKRFPSSALPFLSVLLIDVREFFFLSLIYAKASPFLMKHFLSEIYAGRQLQTFRLMKSHSTVRRLDCLLMSAIPHWLPLWAPTYALEWFASNRL